jgi:hypothetical protein
VVRHDPDFENRGISSIPIYFNYFASLVTTVGWNLSPAIEKVLGISPDCIDCDWNC